MRAVQGLIDEVSQKVRALQTAQALYSRQLAPNFNTFDYINTDELGLSRILADLLNPQGGHAQKADFLRLFIQYCLPSIYKDAHWQSFIEHIEQTKVIIEETTRVSETSRRMDIYLQCRVGDDSYGICIENKPYATDQFEQIKDYAQELKNRRLTQWHIVYLNENSETPDEYSIKPEDLRGLKEDNQFSALKFSDLLDWLKSCQVECQNHSVTEFLAQLIKFIQKQFMGVDDMSESNAVLEVIKQSPESIDASIKVYNAVDEMKKDLIKKLKADLIKKSKKTDYELDISYFGDGKNYERIEFTSAKFDKGYICFEFQSANFNYPCLGFKFDSRDDHSAHKHAEKMKTVFTEAFPDKKIWSSPLWPAGYYFSPQDWKGSSEAWLMINNGTMADKILEEMDTVFQVLKDNHLINE